MLIFVYIIPRWLGEILNPYTWKERCCEIPKDLFYLVSYCRAECTFYDECSG